MLTRKEENGSPSTWRADTASDLAAGLQTGTGEERACAPLASKTVAG